MALCLPTALNQSSMQGLYLIFAKQILHTAAIMNSFHQLGFTVHVLKISLLPVLSKGQLLSWVRPGQG